MATRYYTATTKESLFLLSRGNCYEPSCKNRVMEKKAGKWVTLVQVAHIRGLNRGSARFEETDMPVSERNNFENLLLLCSTHHKLVDGARTWMNYSVTTLTAWKEQREGDLGGDLGQVDWITEETLRDIMAEAIEDTQGRILEGLDDISTVSGETLATLKTLVAETLNLPYLDPDDIASLGRSADVLQMVMPEFVPQLSESARMLQQVTDHSYMLYEAGKNLVNLADYADTLHYALLPLKELRQLLPQLQELSVTVSGTSVSGYMGAARQMSEAAASVRDSAQALASVEIPDIDLGAYQEPAVVLARAGRLSWKTFWWGFAACAVFVIAVLSLWAYATGHAHK